MTKAKLGGLNHELKIEYLPIATLKADERNARTHSPKQIAQIAASIEQFGFNNPVLIAADNLIIAGHGRVQALKLLGETMTPILRLEHLNEVERRAYALAENRLAELAGWDRDILRIELQALAALDIPFDLEITGFETSELDNLLDGGIDEQDPADRQFEPKHGAAITNVGDIWVLGDHRLSCADACITGSYAGLMQGERARMVFCDPPFNVKIDGHVSGLGTRRHREFVAASGEMSDSDFCRFLADSLGAMAGNVMDGGICYVCMDWRHAGLLADVGSTTFSELKNIVVWNKTNAGMGSFYRSKHEFIFVFKVGRARHINNFGLGEKGRYRTNVWDYPGVNAFGKGRDDALGMHPTVKNCAMVCDAIKDVSRRGEIVLDGFGGSGTTLIAAQKTGRRARLLELDPLYCDVICRRFLTMTGIQPVHAASGRTFREMERSTINNTPLQQQEV
ncbi:MAG: ParB N-terminal domain-containing protein [Rhizobiaceae bacterium]|nr:ParB N-terminal domain-containing protein [Rhizobiaceae bacterium]